MVTDNHYRWDFVGLSTDNKPTPATSEKVVDGSTFYCSDTSKLYAYTAGSGINITDSTISVDTTTIQEKLTAGTNITISDENVISASGGSSVRELTSADYNYPSDNPTRLNLWLLDAGEYIVKQGTTAYYADGYAMSTSAEDIPVTIHKAVDSVLITYLRTGNTPVIWVTLSVNPSSGALIEGSNYTSGIYYSTYNALNAVNNLAGQCTPLAAYQGKVLNDKIKPASGAAAPTTATTGDLGKIYIDTTNLDAYICVDTTGGTYTWKKITA